MMVHGAEESQLKGAIEVLVPYSCRVAVGGNAMWAWAARSRLGACQGPRPARRNTHSSAALVDRSRDCEPPGPTMSRVTPRTESPVGDCGRQSPFRRATQARCRRNGCGAVGELSVKSET